MKYLYLDCFSGISGDMLLSALLDLGVPQEIFQEVIGRLGIPVTLRGEEVHRGGIRATHLVLTRQAPQPRQRSYRELLDIVRQGRLAPQLASRVEAALLRLAQAEAAVHGIEVEQVHFHELGGLDTLVDLAGAFAGIDHLGAAQVWASPLPLTRGRIKTAHGPLPLPTPATLQLLTGVPTYGVPLEAELVTPTGAVLVTSLADSFGPPPAARWERIGYGAGSQELPHPNVLRLWVGEALPGYEKTEQGLLFDQDQVLVLETQVDDLNPELFPHLRAELEREGALDVVLLPALMKKGRPGQLVTILAPPDRLQALATVLFRESSALGLRWYQAGRLKLFRTYQEVTTPFGVIPVKLGFATRPDGSRVCLNLAPEYEACARCARAAGRSVKEVYQAALRGVDRRQLPLG